MTRRSPTSPWAAVALLWAAVTWGAEPIGRPIAAIGPPASHVFRYVVPPGGSPSHVFVAGDFNGWSTSATPMVRQGDGTYSVAVDLTDGTHSYKFVVDGHWQTDPVADRSLESDDGNGGHNSGLVAGLSVSDTPPPRPGEVDAAAVAFNPTDVRDLDVIDAGRVRLSLRARADDVAEAAVVLQGGALVPMAAMDTTRGLTRFAAVVPPGSFAFELRKPGAVAYVAAGQAYDRMPSVRYVLPAVRPFATPEWSQHAVWYQIFPERFRNGEPGNDPPGTLPWTGRWFANQPGERGTFYDHVYDRRYGGDLQGVRQSLPYLRSLGITAIYLNPVFRAASLHKYDATDYRHIDEHLGAPGDTGVIPGETEDPVTWKWTPSDKLFLDLVADAHRQGFRVIVDGVFNHTGTPFWAFQDVVQHGQASPYAGWFDVTSWTPGTDYAGRPIPFQYWAWDRDNGALPAFKKDVVLGIVHGPREHILAIAKRWLAPDGDPSRGIDGFRLDAPENVPHPFWVDFRAAVKAAKPDALIIGEIWTPAQSWLAGDQFDAVMNYQFAIAAHDFFAGRPSDFPATALDATCGRLVTAYPFQSALSNQTLLDSHDTDRAASMMANPLLGFNAKARMQDNPTYDGRQPTAAQRVRLAQEVAFQMTYVGSPMVYYGDEAGMWGASDPSDRQPMAWPELTFDDPAIKFDHDTFGQYRRLIALRQALSPLQSGFYRKLLADDVAGTFAFARDLGDRHAYVVLNRSPHPATVTVPGVTGDALVNWSDPASVDLKPAGDRPAATLRPDAVVLHVSGGAARVDLPAYGAAVLAPPTRDPQ